MSNQHYQDCIDACYACAAACDHCFSACLNEKEITHMTTCIALDARCAEMCRLTAGFAAKGTPFVKEVAELCAKICDTCAEECSRHEHDHCQECAKRCKECAEACRKVAA